MNKESFPSQLQALRVAVSPFRRKWKKFTKEQDILSALELAAVNSYLKNKSYNKTAQKLKLDQAMVYIYVKHAIEALNIYKVIVNQQGAKIKKRARTRFKKSK